MLLSSDTVQCPAWDVIEKLGLTGYICKLLWCQAPIEGVLTEHDNALQEHPTLESPFTAAMMRINLGGPDFVGIPSHLIMQSLHDVITHCCFPRRCATYAGRRCRWTVHYGGVPARPKHKSKCISAAYEGSKPATPMKNGCVLHGHAQST